ncbi:MAG: lipoyl(octanoyl) transferase LipB [Candidatus Puniceispirillaceae bacterium]
MPQWQIFDTPRLYKPTIEDMEIHVKQMQSGKMDEAIWILSHEPVYTGGSSATDADIIGSSDIPFVPTGRGGQWTYHDEGMRIIYPMLDLQKRGTDLRLYVHTLEAWIIDVLACFSIKGERREGLPGVWVRRPGPQVNYDKIAALGVRISKWVTYHGFSINIDPDLSAFEAIVPCGVSDSGTTSFAALGQEISQPELDMAIKDCFSRHFGKGTKMGRSD